MYASVGKGKMGEGSCYRGGRERWGRKAVREEEGCVKRGGRWSREREWREGQWVSVSMSAQREGHSEAGAAGIHERSLGTARGGRRGDVEGERRASKCVRRKWGLKRNGWEIAE